MRPRRVLAWFHGLPTTTLEGKVFTTATLVFGIFAIAAGGNLKLLVFAAMVAVAIVSCLASARNLAGLTFTRDLPERVRAGDDFEVRLTVTNHRRITPLLSVSVQDALLSPADACVIERIPPGATIVATYRTRILKRGSYPLRQAVFRTRFPFGLFEKQTVRPSLSWILVTPRAARVPADVLAGAGDRRRADAGHPRPDRGGDELRGLREYRPGDPVRHVAWKATARRGALVVRQLDRRRTERTLILLDARPAPGGRAGSSANEKAIRYVVGLAEHARRARRPTDVALFGPELALLRHVERAAGCDVLLETLACLAADPTRGPTELVEQIDRRLVHGSRVVVVTGASEEEREAVEESLRRLGGDPVTLPAAPVRRQVGKASDAA